jgi:hypothetical protein
MVARYGSGRFFSAIVSMISRIRCFVDMWELPARTRRMERHVHNCSWPWRTTVSARLLIQSGQTRERPGRIALRKSSVSPPRNDARLKRMVSLRPLSRSCRARLTGTLEGSSPTTSPPRVDFTEPSRRRQGSSSPPRREGSESEPCYGAALRRVRLYPLSANRISSRFQIFELPAAVGSPAGTTCRRKPAR